jgi:hypothetical protein
MQFLDMIRNETGQIDLLKIEQLDEHISVKKTTLEEEYEAVVREKKEKKKNQRHEYAVGLLVSIGQELLSTFAHQNHRKVRIALDFANKNISLGNCL